MEMLQSMMIFKDLVDAGLKFDPTDYGEQAYVTSIILT